MGDRGSNDLLGAFVALPAHVSFEITCILGIIGWIDFGNRLWMHIVIDVDKGKNAGVGKCLGYFIFAYSLNINLNTN